MTDYKKIQGFEVQTLSSDPTETGWIGSIFYNSTSGTFKTVKPGGVTAGTWASGGNLNTARSSALGMVGTQNDAYIYGRYLDGTETENYNGTSWTSNPASINTGRGISQGTGTTTAALGIGGEYPGGIVGLTESYNGTSWTEVNDLNTARYGGAGAGTQGATLEIAGRNPGRLGNVESWNGTSWTETTDVNTVGGTGKAVGTQTDAIFATRDTSPSAWITNVEQWNGSSWTEIADVNTARSDYGSSGTTSSAIIFGGYGTPLKANTEFWNGTSWTEVNDLATARSVAGTGSSSTSALAAGGYSVPGNYSLTEEWTAPDLVINTLTTS